MLHCVAHARRYFKEAADDDQARSSYARQFFQEIYEIERQLKELSIEERKKLREQTILPKLEAFHTWMTEQYRAVTPKSPIGKALEYSLKRWKELTLFTTDRQLEIDNNRIALDRKNYLCRFSQSSTANRDDILATGKL